MTRAIVITLDSSEPIVRRETNNPQQIRVVIFAMNGHDHLASNLFP
jgi:hypothetical protein